MLKSIELKKPIRVFGDVVTHVNIPDPTVKLQRHIPANGCKTYGELLDLFADIMGWRPKSVMDDMDPDDAAACVEALADFIPGRVATGGTPPS